jgi:hypothetical protein
VRTEGRCTLLSVKGRELSQHLQYPVLPRLPRAEPWRSLASSTLTPTGHSQVGSLGSSGQKVKME